MFRKLNGWMKRFDPDLLDVLHNSEDEDHLVVPAGVGQFSIFYNIWPIRRESYLVPGAEEDREGAALPSLGLSPALTSNGDILETKPFVRCMLFLRVEDLKTCRLVCRNWRLKVNPVLKQRSCVVIHGDHQPGTWFRDGAVEKVLKYLKGSVLKFSLWTTLRLKYVKESQIRVLLSSRDFQISVKSILELELIKCEISWTSLLKIMKDFMNLQVFYDKKSKFLDPEAFTLFGSLSLWLSGGSRAGNNNNSSSAGLSGSPGTIESSFVKKEICLEDLKCLKIYKENAGRNTTDLLRILTVTTVDLEEIHLKLDPQQKQVSVKDLFEFERHLNILFILNAHSLKKLYVDMMDTDHIEYFNDFLKCFRDWTQTTGAVSAGESHSSPRGTRDSATSGSSAINDYTPRVYVMEELVLKFKYIWLSKSFETILIPWVSQLKNLRILGIGSICFKPEAAHLLKSLQETLPPDCLYEFGLCLSDHCGGTSSEGSESSRALGVSLLRSELFRQHMTDLLIGVFHDDIRGVKELLPAELEGPHFEKTVDVCVFTGGPNRPNFTSFDVKHLAYYFDNVTNLEIIDGPYENYFEEFFKTTSTAFINDDDVQLILKCMRRLQKLIIFANMEMLTDSGITGLSQIVCHRMRLTKQYHLEPFEIQGYRFAYLRHLRYLSLRGIGTSLTDVSAYWGFSNIPKLKTLIIAHFNKLSPEARAYLDRSYPASRGCFIAVL